MTPLNVDKYRYYDPLFEGARIVLNYLGDPCDPAYVQGISGAAFKIAGGCPSRPTCICDYWTTDFIRLMGYEATEVPVRGKDGEDLTEAFVAAIKASIDNDRPTLVWHALTNYEWDVVCGYDQEARQFIGKGTYRGGEGYDREDWSRAVQCGIAFGGILIGAKTGELDRRSAEIASLRNAVASARKPMGSEDIMGEGIAFYRRWAELYAAPEADRGASDAYCHAAYSSQRGAAGPYLRGIAPSYGEMADSLVKAAECFEKEAELLRNLDGLISWGAPSGVDEARNAKVTAMLKEAGDCYEAGIGHIERALEQYEG